MELVRDCLDKQIVDRHGQNMGRVDGLVIKLEDGQQPRVSFIELGAVTQARRLHPRLGRLVKKISARWRICPEDPLRIPWSKVVPAGIEVVAGVEAEESAAFAWERWLRRKVIARIPGA